MRDVDVLKILVQLASDVIKKKKITNTYTANAAND